MPILYYVFTVSLALRMLSTGMSNRKDTHREVTEVLKSSNGQLRKLLKDGEIKAFKLGKYKWRIPKAAVEEYVKGKMAG